MTDANGAKSNFSDTSNGRRLRRSARETAESRVSKMGAADGKANQGKPDKNKAGAAGKPLRTSRRTRRRRQRNRLPEQVLGKLGNRTDRTASRTTSNQLGSGKAPSSRRDAENKSMDKSSRKPGAQSGTAGRANPLKVVPSNRSSAPVGLSTRRSARREAARGEAGKSAGRVPLSSSLVRRRSRRPKLPKYLVYISWLLIGGAGIATIFGTMLANRMSEATSIAQAESVLAADSGDEGPFPVALTQEIQSLKAEIEELPGLYPGLKFKAFYVDVDTGDYVDVDGREAIAAASTIKLPLLLAFFEEVDKGNIDPNQTIAMLKEQVAEGSGDMQLSPPGTQFTALEVATQMIVNSDNTATNMMIALLGGDEALNARFASYGLEETRLSNPLPDIEGMNTTSARDLVHSMLLVQGDTLKTRSRDRVLNILKRTENKRLLAAGLEEKGALTYNKTGYIGKMLGDVALVDLSNGKRYAIAVMVERPSNDGRALELIHSISQRSFKHTDQAIQPAVTPLGNPDGNSPPGETAEGESVEGETAAPNRSASDEAASESPAEATSEPSTITITQPEDADSESAAPAEEEAPVVEEAPYPSANPEG